ncbi:unnamed protein product [Ectocarpus sp. 12 AP-2014]
MYVCNNRRIGRNVGTSSWKDWIRRHVRAKVIPPNLRRARPGSWKTLEKFGDRSMMRKEPATPRNEHYSTPSWNAFTCRRLIGRTREGRSNHSCLPKGTRQFMMHPTMTSTL